MPAFSIFGIRHNILSVLLVFICSVCSFCLFVSTTYAPNNTRQGSYQRQLLFALSLPKHPLERSTIPASASESRLPTDIPRKPFNCVTQQQKYKSCPSPSPILFTNMQELG